MLGIILLLIIFSPMLFCPLDMLYYIYNRKRTSPLIRTFFEIMVFVIFPYFAYFFGLTEDIEKLITAEAFYSLSVLCIISYFITSYSNSTYSFIGEILLILAISGGFIINCLTFILLSFKNKTLTPDMSISFLGCFPIFIFLSTALIQQYRRYKSLQQWDEEIDI